jgi:hypothetical protein
VHPLQSAALAARSSGCTDLNQLRLHTTKDGSFGVAHGLNLGTSENGRIGMLTARAYWIVLLSVFLGLTATWALGERGAELTCWPGGYEQNAWLAYCNSKRFGVFDVEAIWHHVESDVVPNIAAAKVLTISDSHLQNALSLGNASQWFAAHRYPVYMLGLPTEESEFGERLIDNFQPHPDVVILDASPYFTGGLGSFEQAIFNDQGASRKAVLGLKDFQTWHQRFCDQLPWACGHNFAYYRSRQDGHWIFPEQSSAIWIGWNDVPNDNRQFPTGQALNEDLSLYPKYLDSATRLVKKLHMPADCIVITHVPAEENLRGLAQYIGHGLGLTVIDPDVPDLTTFDRAHLTPASSKRWTQAFLQALEPVLEHCVNTGAASAAGAITGTGRS